MVERAYEPSSHSGSTKLPPPLTAGIQDFLAAAATTVSLLGATEPPVLALVVAANKDWLLLPPLTKDEPKPLSKAAAAADVAAILSLMISWRS